MSFKKNLDINVLVEDLDFGYGPNVFHPQESEKRRLKDIKPSLLDCGAKGPEILYSIAMDVGKKSDKNELMRRNLLYGIVIYNHGLIGREPVRSQGHVHAISKSCDFSTPEVYEIWQGEAIIFMQEKVSDEIGKCFAVNAKAGDIVIVPPGWAHYTVNSNINRLMVFGAWCIRDYGFEYEEIRKRKGLAFYPIYEHGQIVWAKNTSYKYGEVKICNPRIYKELGLTTENLYEQYENNNNIFEFVTNPKKYMNVWDKFVP